MPQHGDAARALLAASQRGHRVDRALAGTLDWLSHPEQWDQNKGEGGFDDKALAHVQFAGGLTSAHEAKIPAASASILASAAALVAADQKPDGSWRLQTSQGVGSPVTYGTALVTWSALRATGDRRFEQAIARGEAWIRGLAVETVLDASAVKDLCQSTAVPPIVTPRSLGLAHLRTALWFHGEETIDRFVTVDVAQEEAAREVGLPVSIRTASLPAEALLQIRDRIERDPHLFQNSE